MISFKNVCIVCIAVKEVCILKKKSGPSIEPCGTPYGIKWAFETRTPIFIKKKYD